MSESGQEEVEVEAPGRVSCLVPVPPFSQRDVHPLPVSAGSAGGTFAGDPSELNPPAE